MKILNSDGQLESTIKNLAEKLHLNFLRSYTETIELTLMLVFDETTAQTLST